MRYSVVLIFLILFSSCKKDSKSNGMGSDFKLTATVMSGWCGSSKIVSISKEKTKVVIPANEKCDIAFSEKEVTTEEMKYEQLQKLLEQVDFKSLSLNECARCADGTDYKIEVTENGRTYVNTIAHVFTDGELSEVQKRQQELLKFLDSF